MAARLWQQAASSVRRPKHKHCRKHARFEKSAALFMAKLFLVCFLFTLVSAEYTTEPQQVHLSFGQQVNDIIVTWSTQNPTKTSVVGYTINYRKFYNTSGTETKFVDGGSLHRIQYIHRVTLKNLRFNTTYYYRCGDYHGGWSDQFHFTTVPAAKWSPTLAVYGDLGDANSRSLPLLQELAQNGQLAAIIHDGDFAYDLHSLQGLVGDHFMRDIEPIAAYIPYMTAVGNHEQAYNFSHYKNRFSMPANENFYYSFNLGSACFVAFSTEFYFVDHKLAKRQYTWLKQTLLDSNCSRAPWLFTYGHRPMYCSSLDHDDCTRNSSIIRTALEELFYKAGVDVAIWAHEHNYERTYPVYQERVYLANKAPVHIISGSAGCKEDHDPIKGPRGPWSAYRSEDYGFGLLTILNATHVYWEQISVDVTPAKVIDSLYLIKEHVH